MLCILISPLKPRLVLWKFLFSWLVMLRASVFSTTLAAFNVSLLSFVCIDCLSAFFWRWWIKIILTIYSDYSWQQGDRKWLLIVMALQHWGSGVRANWRNWVPTRVCFPIYKDSSLHFAVQNMLHRKLSYWRMSHQGLYIYWRRLYIWASLGFDCEGLIHDLIGMLSHGRYKRGLLDCELLHFVTFCQRSKWIPFPIFADFARSFWAKDAGLQGRVCEKERASAIW